MSNSLIEPPVTSHQSPVTSPALPLADRMKAPPRFLPRGHILPSPLNPRKIFEAEGLAELAVSERRHGVFQDLLVRPMAERAGFFEIIVGERRWRASGEITVAAGTAGTMTLPALGELPCKVIEAGDAEALELMLAENMKRRDLTPLEEAEAFAVALAMRNGDGRAVHTQATLAAAISASQERVSQRLLLLKLPRAGRESLAAGKLTIKVAELLGRLPGSVMASACELVLQPGRWQIFTDAPGEPLGLEQAAKEIDERFLRDLALAAWDLKDASFYPAKADSAGERSEGGACADCPWNTANQTGGAVAETRRGPRSKAERPHCTQPGCFAKKQEIFASAQILKIRASAEKAGVEVRILSAEESTGIFPHGGHVLPWDSDHFELGEKPGEAERNKTISETQTPTWEKIVFGEMSAEVVMGRAENGDAIKGEVSGKAHVPILIAMDGKGRVRRLIGKKEAFSAAQKNKTDHYLALGKGRGTSLQSKEADESSARERDERKIGNAVSAAAMAAVVESVSGPWGKQLWQWMGDVALYHGGSDAEAFLVKRRGLDADKGGDFAAADAIAEHRKKLATVGELQGFAVEALLARQVKFSGFAGDDAKAICKLAGVNLAALEKKVRADLEKKGRLAASYAPTKTVAETVEDGMASEVQAAAEITGENAQREGLKKCIVSHAGMSPAEWTAQQKAKGSGKLSNKRKKQIKAAQKRNRASKRAAKSAQRNG